MHHCHDSHKTDENEAPETKIEQEGAPEPESTDPETNVEQQVAMVMKNKVTNRRMSKLLETVEQSLAYQQLSEEA